MKHEPFSVTVKELMQRGRHNIPAELISSTHLIYNSPAALAFNSPGAQGFGVKRAGLAIPGSIMILVGPGCCGRNTTILSEMGGYSERFFFYTMDEADVVTGRHLIKIPQAVQKVCDSLDTAPSVVMVCMTCIDALLGTDMERVCRKAAVQVGIPVVPCYMYALTREGINPPMVAVRQAVYSLLEPQKKQADMVNILGYFSPLIDECEIYQLLKQMGIKRINEISRCKNIEEYKNMAKANFNLVLHPESRLAAQDIQKRLDIPSIELTRMHQIDKIRNQYHIFAKALGAKINDDEYYEKAKQSIDDFAAAYGNAVFAVGEMMNGNPFELSLALSRYGFKVAEIYGNLAPEDFTYIKKMTQLSPDTRVFSNLSPSMIYYDEGNKDINITIGKDAAYYHQDTANIHWTEEQQPFGYAGVTKLFHQLKAAMDAVQRGQN